MYYARLECGVGVHAGQAGCVMHVCRACFSSRLAASPGRLSCQNSRVLTRDISHTLSLVDSVSSPRIARRRGVASGGRRLAELLVECWHVEAERHVGNDLRRERTSVLQAAWHSGGGGAPRRGTSPAGGQK